MSLSHSDLISVLEVPAGLPRSSDCVGRVGVGSVIGDPAGEPPGVRVMVCACSKCGATIVFEIAAAGSEHQDVFHVPARLRNVYGGAAKHPPALQFSRSDGVGLTSGEDRG